MPELGDKHICADCETKYYDLGRADATCPKCGSANRIVDDESAASSPRAPRPRSQPKQEPTGDEAATDEIGEGAEELDLDEEVGAHEDDEE